MDFLYSFAISDISDKLFYTKISVSYLIVLPVPEKVDRAVSSPLQYGPASVVEAVFTPGLDQLVAVIWLQQVHPAGSVSCLAHLETVPKRPCEFIIMLFLFVFMKDWNYI